MPLALLLAYAQGQCLRRFISVGPDCGIVSDTCTLNSVNGAPITTIPFSSDKYHKQTYENMGLISLHSQSPFIILGRAQLMYISVLSLFLVFNPCKYTYRVISG